MAAGWEACNFLVAHMSRMNALYYHMQNCSGKVPFAQCKGSSEYEKHQMSLRYYVCACVFMRGKSVMPLVFLIMLVRGTVASATCMQCTLTGLGCCCSNAIMSTTCHRPPSQQANKQVNKQTSRWKTKQINRKPKRRMADQLLLLLVG